MMDWNEVLSAVIKLAITVLCGVISAYVIPWINAKVESLKVDMEAKGMTYVCECIEKFVAAAEQLAINEGYDGDWKKRYVIDMMEKNLGITVDEELDACIESTVILLHKALYGVVEE